MAAARSFESPNNKTVLRLKRKRSEDPADLLLVSHAFKKTFKLADLTENTENNPVQRLFRLAGTVSQTDHALSPKILDNLKRNEQKSKGKNTPQSVAEINEKLRERKQVSSETSRYKIVSKRRENEKQRNLVKKANENNTEKEISSFYNMYDAVIDDLETTKTNEESKKATEERDPNAILCNSVKMIREKLHIENEYKDVDMNDYVYDVYCAEDEFGELEDVLDIVRLNECQLVSEVEVYDDEDDSNDEDNWRNDYPDEDQWSRSSNEEPRYKSEYFDYGWQLDDLDRGFGKLSSDEENEYLGRFNQYGKDDEHYSFEVVDNEDD